MIDNKIVAQNHQKIEKNAIFLKKKSTFLGKFAQKVFQNRVYLCNKNSCLQEKYSKIEYSIIEFLLY